MSMENVEESNIQITLSFLGFIRLNSLKMKNITVCVIIFKSIKIIFVCV